MVCNPFIFIVLFLPGLLSIRTTVSAAGVKVNYSAGFKNAARYFLQFIDLTVDPCQNFYKFTCNTYLKNNKSGASPGSVSQAKVFSQIAAQLPTISSSSSLTEQIFDHGYQSCLLNYNYPKKELSYHINTDLLSQIGGLPMLTPGWQALEWNDLWRTIGRWESQYNVPSILTSYVSVDYGNASRHVLHVSQGHLGIARDYYFKMENLAVINNYRSKLIKLIQKFDRIINTAASDDDIANAVTNSVKFEISLALAMVPSELTRNFVLQYNPYNLTQLNASYPNIRWKDYFEGLLQDVDPNFRQDNYIVKWPSYISAVDSMIGGRRINQRVIADYIGIKLLCKFAVFIGPKFREINENIARYSSKSQQFYKKADLTCVKFMNEKMPFGAGYIYVAQKKYRNVIRADNRQKTKLIIESFVNMTRSLSWLDRYSRKNLIAKKDKLIQNIGWPYWYNFTNTSYMDNVYHKYYHNITKINIKDFFTMKLSLSRAQQLTKNFGLLGQLPDRRQFQMSPAIVNAAYSANNNNINIPLAKMTLPAYRFDFPQAFNFGSQGQTLGHELTHGYDTKGVQFGPEGELSNCTWDRCGWMGTKSTLGFLKMAKCVVEQYSERCCPLKTGNARCVNGAKTQSENIADIGGMQAAYKAYRKFIKVNRNGVEEGRLPGLERLTPNQIFWISSGIKRCRKLTNTELHHQLLTDVHSPAECRINQMVRDIPEFGKDFKCRINTPLYPRDNNRCKVWTDATLI